MLPLKDCRDTVKLQSIRPPVSGTVSICIDPMSDKDSESPTQPNDDRNIAKVDSDIAGLTPDEQLTLIWDKYKSLVIKVAASLPLLVPCGTELR